MHKYQKAQALQDHKKKVSALSQILTSQKQVSFSRANPSHTTRDNAHKQKHSTVDLSSLQSIIHIDVENKIVLAEPGVTMQALVRATLKEGHIPCVVPEFRTITVGGAIAGASAESSSHLFGLFSDTCVWYEVLLGDGQVIQVSKEKHKDLFFGITGSYGSLALITLAAIQLMPAKPFVQLHIDSTQSCDDAVFRLTHSASLFTDGLALPNQSYLIMQAKMQDTPSSSQYKTRAWSPWFYQYLQSSTLKKEITIPIEDYLFRYDRGAFWMGQYVLPFSLIPTHFFNWPLSLNTYASRIDNARQNPKWPNLWFRLLFGWLMSSRRLYQRFHTLPKSLTQHTFVIQDCCLPASQANQFIQTCLQKWGIKPLWLCPIRKASSFQLFAPHSITDTDPVLLNIGLYGAPEKKADAIRVTQEIEEMTLKLGGRKVLYSYSYYEEDTFWSIYDKKTYLDLRKKYHADRFIDITQKVLQNLSE